MSKQTKFRTNTFEIAGFKFTITNNNELTTYSIDIPNQHTTLDIDESSEFAEWFEEYA